MTCILGEHVGDESNAITKSDAEPEPILITETKKIGESIKFKITTPDTKRQNQSHLPIIILILRLSPQYYHLHNPQNQQI